MIHIAFLLILITLIISGYLGHALLLGTVLFALSLSLSLCFLRQVRGLGNSLTAICFKLAGDWFISWSLGSFIILVYHKRKTFFLVKPF